MMGKTTEIAWCDSTFNPVIGCMKVSAGCDLCYAEDLMDNRYGRVKWGQRKTDATVPSVGTRVRTSAAYWRQPIVWNKKAAAFQARHLRRQRVFCASLSDVFDNQWDPKDREDLWSLIWATPQLDWLLLTKRPENIAGMIAGLTAGDVILSNVWFGTTCEDQAAFDKRWPILREVRAAVRFISYEPAIGPLRIFTDGCYPKGLSWLICGGESGRGYRPMEDRWANDVRNDCARAGVPYFFKQMAGKRPIPNELLVRQFPQT